MMSDDEISARSIRRNSVDRRIQFLPGDLLNGAPKKYGDKIDATLAGPDGGSIQTENIVVEYIRQKDKKDPV